MLMIQDLSKEIDTTAVHGGSLASTQFGSGQFVSGGGLVIAVQVDPQISTQNAINVDNTLVTNVLGTMNAAIAHYMG